MKEKIFLVGRLALAGLGLGACDSLDMNNVISLKCGVNPQLVDVERMELVNGQSFMIDGKWINVVGPGRLRFQNGLDLQGNDVITGSDSSSKRFRVHVTNDGDKTVTTITFNCADPKNP